MTESNTSAPAEAPEYRKRGRSKTPLIITIAVIAVAAIVAALVFWLGRDRDSTCLLYTLDVYKRQISARPARSKQPRPTS